MDPASVTCGLVILAVIGVFGGGIALYFYNRGQTDKRLRHAYANYQQSLELLKQQPHNPELRQRTLEWGRYYSNLTRDNRGVTVYDEVALANDINAACAGGGHVGRDPAVAEARPLEERLGQLKALFEKEVIDELEYNDRRSKLLDEV